MIGLFVLLGGGVLSRSGDIFLSYLGGELGIDIAYQNHSGFISCFVLRFIEITRPVFVLKDFDVALVCQKAFIEPRFDKVLNEKKIILKCFLKNASFLSIAESIKKNKSGLPFGLADDTVAPLIEALNDLLFETVTTTLVIFGERLDFPDFRAYSKNVKLFATGFIDESGNFDLKLKVFFSPETASEFPEELTAFLVEEGFGWVSYYVDFGSDRNDTSLNFESSKFKLDFKEVKIH